MAPVSQSLLDVRMNFSMPNAPTLWCLFFVTELQCQLLLRLVYSSSGGYYLMLDLLRDVNPSGMTLMVMVSLLASLFLQALGWVPIGKTASSTGGNRRYHINAIRFGRVFPIWY
jgi:hypothetical protein